MKVTGIILYFVEKVNHLHEFIAAYVQIIGNISYCICIAFKLSTLHFKEINKIFEGN